MRASRWHLLVALAGFFSLHCGGPPPGGTGGTGGTGGSGGSGGSLPTPTMLPQVQGTCPTLQNGSNSITLNGISMNWTVWVGDPNNGPGPALIYWHGTGMTAQEASVVFGDARIQEIVSQGGIVASAESTSNTGSNTGNNVWFRGDFNYADQIIACAMQQLGIDTRRIYTMGYSAGALQATAMGHDRSGYLAAYASYSGGLLFPNAQQDPNRLPPAAALHGAQGSDVVIIDFYDASHRLEDEYTSKGFFIIDCNDGEGHVSGTRIGLTPMVWQFFKDHPYKVNPEPYTTLPSGWPSYCSIP